MNAAIPRIALVTGAAVAQVLAAEGHALILN